LIRARAETCQEGIHGRGTGRDEGARPGAEGREEERGSGTRRAREDRRDAESGPGPGQADPRDRHGHRTVPLAENLVRDACYANDDGKIVCFFQSADKFKSRYATFGFNQAANLDQGAMWPTSFALTELTPKEEAKIGALVKKAVR
jgi:hypothetical protein